MPNSFQEEKVRTIIKTGVELFGDALDVKFKNNSVYKLIGATLSTGVKNKDHVISETLSNFTSKCIEYNDVIGNDYDRLRKCDHVEIFFRSGEEIYNLDQSQLDRLGIKQRGDY